MWTPPLNESAELPQGALYLIQDSEDPHAALYKTSCRFCSCMSQIFYYLKYAQGVVHAVQVLFYGLNFKG